VGWALGRTLAARLPLAALAHSLAERHPPPGLVHHSDRGVQCASEEYVTMLRTHHMIPSMSRPANPYDNASCESFMKTLKREEIDANTYRDLYHLRADLAVFIEQYDNRDRLHSARAISPSEGLPRPRVARAEDHQAPSPLILPSSLVFPLLEGHPCWSMCGRRTRPFLGRAFRGAQDQRGCPSSFLL
jgi:transposase InsO family protein